MLEIIYYTIYYILILILGFSIGILFVNHKEKTEKIINDLKKNSKIDK